MPFPVGTTPDGREVTGDFGQTPHVLVGGIAGSGKTHFLHSLIRSLAENHSPAELRRTASSANPASPRLFISGEVR